MADTGSVLIINLNDERWVAFVESSSQANIFHHPMWSNLLGECYGYQPFVVALIDNQDRLHAGLPMLDVSSLLTGRRWVSLPFTDYCSPLYEDLNALDRLTNGLINLSQAKNNHRVEVRGELTTSSAVKTSSQFVQHSVNLDRDIEEISKSLHRTQRQNIKTAEKNGIRIERGEDLAALKTFYHLHCLTRRRQGVPVQPWRFFKLLLESIIENGHGFILLAYKSDHCLAAGLFLYWRQALIYKYAASDDIEQDLRPNHLLTWTAINWGCENRIKFFDFGRTEIANEGLRTFKIRWGAAEAPLTYSFLFDDPKQVSSDSAQAVMHSVIKNSPVWACRLAGEVLYKHFG
jgi:hypothetical protein